MTSVAAVSNPANPATTSAAQSTVDATQDRFLKLLVAQMQNQDPLNPLDNSQVTSQLAQLSTVTGINKLNDTITALSSAFNQTQSLQAASMIGRSVLTAGDTTLLQNGQAMGGFELTQPADQVSVSIQDAAGKVVHTANLGPQSAGAALFQWDGVQDNGATAPDGFYKFQVQAVQAGKAIDITPLAQGKVASVTLGSQGVQLNVDGLGAVSLTDVQQIM
jgi:flagellar basal-body rod modification protein FlgD